MKESKFVTFDFFNEIIPIPYQEFNNEVWWSKEELDIIKLSIIKLQYDKYLRSHKNLINR